MRTHPSPRRLAAVVAVLAAVLAASVALAPPASAQAPTPVEHDLDARLHLAGLGLDLDFEGGTFTGTVDLDTGAITGDAVLPVARGLVDLLGVIPLARATVELVPVGSATGSLDVAEGTATLEARFHLRLPSLDVLGLGLASLTGPDCRTVRPLGVTLTGAFDPAGTSTLTGEFTLPRFAGCGLLTPVLNLLLPGGGNTLTTTSTPAGA